MLGESETINVADIQKAAYKGQFGQDGVVNIADTIAATPAAGKVFVALQVVADAVVDAIAETGATGSLAADTALAAGMTLYGCFTSVKLKSGKVRAYQGVAV
jgi:hypothetical protein